MISSEHERKLQKKRLLAWLGAFGIPFFAWGYNAFATGSDTRSDRVFLGGALLCVGLIVDYFRFLAKEPESHDKELSES